VSATNPRESKSSAISQVYEKKSKREMYGGSGSVKQREFREFREPRELEF
jgi:hypothetical protein